MMRSQSQPVLASNGQSEAENTAAFDTCKACFKTAAVEPAQVLRGERYTPSAEWVDSSVMLCANESCRAIRAGTLADRLAFVSGEYGYKYFGDYELSEQQATAAWEAYRIARLVPDLLEALRYCLREHGGFTIAGECERQARAAIAKAEGGL